MWCLNRLAGGLGDLILNRCTSYSCDSVAMLNLNRNKFDLRVVNTVLSGDLTASMFDSSLNGVSYSMGNWSNRVGSVTTKELGISFGISLSLTLTISSITMVTSNRGNWSNWCSRCITKSVDNLLADLLVLNFFSIDYFSCANILSGRYTSLSDKDFNSGNTVCCRNGCWDSSSIRSCKELRISLSLCISCRSSTSDSYKARQSKKLK